MLALPRTIFSLSLSLCFSPTSLSFKAPFLPIRPPTLISGRYYHSSPGSGMEMGNIWNSRWCWHRLLLWALRERQMHRCLKYSVTARQQCYRHHPTTKEQNDQCQTPKNIVLRAVHTMWNATKLGQTSSGLYQISVRNANFSIQIMSF